MFLLEGAYFVSFCSLYAYTVTILLDYGYTEVQCGYITMLQYLVMMIAGPIYGRLIDRSISPKWLFIILVAGGMIVTPLLPSVLAAAFFGRCSPSVLFRRWITVLPVFLIPGPTR